MYLHIRMASQKPNLLDPQISIISLTQDLLLGSDCLGSFSLFAWFAFFVIVFRNEFGSSTAQRIRSVHRVMNDTEMARIHVDSPFIQTQRLTEITDVSDCRGKRQIWQLGDPQGRDRIPIHFPHRHFQVQLSSPNCFASTQLKPSRNSPDPDKFDRNMYASTEYPLILFRRSRVLTRSTGLFDFGMLGRGAERRVGKWDIGRGCVDAPGAAKRYQDEPRSKYGVESVI
jgi:hypothetical protein